jgi:glycerol-3-phosphate dehydrogenase
VCREIYGFDKDVAKHLSMNYGTRALQVAEIARADLKMAARIVPRYPFLAAEVIFSCEQEYAQTAVDVLARRTRLAFLNADSARQAIPGVVELMGNFYGWNGTRRKVEVERAHSYISGMEVSYSPSGRAPTQLQPENLA